MCIVYFAGVKYAWAIGDPGRNSSFICETALQDSYKIVEQKRDFGRWNRTVTSASDGGGITVMMIMWWTLCSACHWL